MAQGMAQEAWINAWRALAQIDLRYPFRPWMLRIVTNRCRMERRRRHAPQTALHDGEEDALPTDGAAALVGMLRQEEVAAVARWTPHASGSRAIVARPGRDPPTFVKRAASQDADSRSMIWSQTSLQRG